MKARDAGPQDSRLGTQPPVPHAGPGLLSGFLIGLLIVIVIIVLLLGREDPVVGMAP